MSQEATHMFVHEIHLPEQRETPEQSEFARKFNHISDLFQEWQQFEKTDAPEEEKLAKFNAFFDAKFALESGF